VLEVFVDGDACPVKDEVYKVALRYGLKVYVVFCGALRTQAPGRVEFVRVKQGFDAADDWIAERASAGDIVITADIPLADRALRSGAVAVGPTGKEFTEDAIGNAVAQRALMDQLRAMGEVSGGPPPFSPRDRSRFLATLDTVIQRLKRRQRAQSEAPEGSGAP
jgi:uncharacterized protein YaiI (UPF0178 family)